MQPDLLFAAPHHPLLIGASTSCSSVHGLVDYATNNAATVDELLSRHGGVLFRGFGLHEPADMSRCALALGAEPFGYAGGNSPRTRVSEEVFTSTDYPASEAISLHNEMSYLSTFPRRLFFMCVTPATSGGQTSLANSRDVLTSMPSEIVESLRKRKINYVRTYQNGIGKSWQDTYQVTDREQAEALIKEQGSTCVWQADGRLRVNTVCDALMDHPDSGQEVWFNQAEQWHPSALRPQLRTLLEEAFGKGQLAHHCQYGDGEELDEQTLAEIRRVLDANKLLFDWQAGDLLMLDNVSMMHGREQFKGARKTLAYLSSR